MKAGIKCSARVHDVARVEYNLLDRPAEVKCERYEDHRSDHSGINAAGERVFWSQECQEEVYGLE